jgi:hypothetical protein
LTVVGRPFRILEATARLRLGRASRRDCLVSVAEALLAVLDGELGGLPRRISRAPRSALRGDGSLLGHPGDLIRRLRAPIGLVRGLRCDLGQALGELRSSRGVAPPHQQLARAQSLVVHAYKLADLNVPARASKPRRRYSAAKTDRVSTKARV